MLQRRALAVLGTALALLVLTLPAPAQQLSYHEAKRVIERIEKGGDRFEDSLKDALNRGGFDSPARDNAKRLVDDFEDAADVLKSNYDKDDAAVPAARAVLQHAAAIDEFVVRHGLSGRAAEDWRTLRADLDRLSQAYAVKWTWPVVVVQPAPQAATVHTPGVIVEKEPSDTAVIVEQPRASVPYRISHEQLEELIERIEHRADTFRSSLDYSLDKSQLDDTSAEDTVKRYMKDFENATDQLKDRYDDNNSAVGSVKEVLTRAASIDQFLRTHNMSSRAKDDWASLRADLDQLAAAYNATFDWNTVVFVVR